MKKFIVPLFGLLTPFTPLAAFVKPPATLLPTPSITALCDFYDLIQVVASWIVVFGLIIGVVFIIVGGVKYVTSGGDESKTKDAKNMMMSAVIGVVLLIVAMGAIAAIASFFGTTITLNFTTTNC